MFDSDCHWYHLYFMTFFTLKFWISPKTHVPFLFYVLSNLKTFFHHYMYQFKNHHHFDCFHRTRKKNASKIKWNHKTRDRDNTHLNAHYKANIIIIIFNLFLSASHSSVYPFTYSFAFPSEIISSHLISWHSLYLTAAWIFIYLARYTKKCHDSDFKISFSSTEYLHIDDIKVGRSW